MEGCSRTGWQVDTQELISLARELAARAVGSGPGDPRQTDLRRAVSSAYYAMFHALCTICADMLAGADQASARPTSWLLAYRALEHGYARNRFRDYSGMTEFPRAIRRFGDLFVEMQRLRQLADYDPSASFEPDTVSEHIERASRAIADLTRAPRADLRALALYVLLRPRRE